jgi:hypothetical protein
MRLSHADCKRAISALIPPKVQGPDGQDWTDPDVSEQHYLARRAAFLAQTAIGWAHDTHPMNDKLDRAEIAGRTARGAFRAAGKALDMASS